jgi:hypothetical protein
MTEYEVRDLGASFAANILEMGGMQGEYISIYITVVFAFIAAAYVVGRDLNKLQTTVATILFCLVCLWLVYRITILGIGINFMMEASKHELLSQFGEGRTEWRDIVSGGHRVVITASIWSLGMLGALVFLWNIRHEKEE